MAWLFTRETFGRQYQEGVAARTGIRQYLCLSDTEIIDINEVLDNSELPNIGAAWSGDQLSLIVTNRIPKEIDKETGLYLVTIEYASPDYEFELDWQMDWSAITEEVVLDKNMEYLKDTGNPANRAASTSDLLDSDDEPFFGNIYLLDVTEAYTNDPVINSAWDFYDPPINTTLRIPTVTLQTVLNYIPSHLTVDFVMGSIGKCNDGPIRIAGKDGVKWQWLIDDVRFSNFQTNTGETKLTLNFKLVWHPRLHLKYVINAGYNQLIRDSIGEPIKKIPILDASKKEVNQPYPLDYLGAPLDSDDILGLTMYHAWAPTTTIDFSVFGFPEELYP